MKKCLMVLFKEKEAEEYHNMMLLQHYRMIVCFFECFPKNANAVRKLEKSFER